MSQSDERHYYQPTFGFLFEDDMGELLEDFDQDEYDLFYPIDEGSDEEVDEAYIDMYDQMSYVLDHGE